MLMCSFCLNPAIAGHGKDSFCDYHFKSTHLDAQTLAKMLDGNEYGNEMTKEIEEAAKRNNLVIVFGYSDDNLELRGAINDEIGAFQGTEVFIDKQGVMPECECECRCRRCKLEYIGSAKKITAKWIFRDYSWFIDSEIPHYTFDILEDGQKFCRGIVFSLNDL